MVPQVSPACHVPSKGTADAHPLNDTAELLNATRPIVNNAPASIRTPKDKLKRSSDNDARSQHRFRFTRYRTGNLRQSRLGNTRDMARTR
ncbi:hypothetical protein PUN4_80068 [Paraburkholderia unamae]|nr:hypothetical protein PUN4_80068 [Paraburkholderia unamae]